jgi:hypothetical protein
VRAAGRNRVQTSLNLAYGSALASIGLTIPAIAVASIWVGGPLTLGLNPKELVLLALTVVVSILTIAPGRATLMQGSVHLGHLLGAFPAVPLFARGEDSCRETHTMRLIPLEGGPPRAVPSRLGPPVTRVEVTRPTSIT